MSNLPLEPLVWKQKGLNPLAELELTAYSALHEYVITEPKQGKFELKKTRLGEPSKKSEYLENFDTLKEAQDWAWAHYQRSMHPYVKTDSITDIANWFKKAKPEPTSKDITTQIGCHFEEFAENLEAINADADDIHEAANDMKSAGSNLSQADVDLFVSIIKRTDLLDALCDQIVTATGVAYMMGFDIEGALKEVIRSNNSKMVDGKFEFDDNGKIAKPDSFSEPDLTPFLGECL